MWKNVPVWEMGEGKAPQRREPAGRALCLWGERGAAVGAGETWRRDLTFPEPWGGKQTHPAGKLPLQTAIAHLSKPAELRQSFQTLGNSPTGSFQQCELSRPGTNVLTSLFPDLAPLNGRFVEGTVHYHSILPWPQRQGEELGSCTQSRAWGLSWRRGDPLNLHRSEKWRAVTGQQRWSQLASDRIHSFCLSGNWFQTTNPPTSHRWKDRDGRSFCVFDSTLKPQHLTRLLFKINIHLDTNRPYGFSKYTSHIIQPHEFPKCQTANLHFLG